MIVPDSNTIGVFDMTNFSNEQWRPVVGYEGRYSVSNLGRIRSERRVINTGKQQYIIPQKMLNLCLQRGYYTFGASKQSKVRCMMVHRAVMEAFVGKRPAGMEIRHLNSIPTDNRLENLAYGTKSENMQDAVKVGTLVFSRSKLSHADIIAIGRDPRPNPVIAKDFNTNIGTVQAIKTGKSFKGFTNGIYYISRKTEELSPETFALVMDRTLKRSEIANKTGLTIAQIKRIRKTGRNIIYSKVCSGDISSI